MRPEVETGLRFHFCVKQLHYYGSHDFGRSETHFGASFTSVEFSMEKENAQSEIKLRRIIKVDN